MDKSTSPLVGAEARRKILSGVRKVLEVIAPTLGPAGMSVLLPRTWNRGPRNADDGYMASQNVILEDEHERLAADTFKESIKLTNQIAGDGTTGTGVLAGHIINKIFSFLPTHGVPIVAPPGQKMPSRKSVRQIRKELLEAKDQVIVAIKEQAKPIKTLADLERVALVSIGKEDETVAKTVAKTVWEVARDVNGNYVNNHIDVVEGYKGELEVEIVRGMRFPAKVAHRAFITNPERFEMIAEDTAVFITNHKLDNPILVQKLLENCKVAKIAFFASDFSPIVIKYLIDVTKGGLFCYPIKCAALRTEQMIDLAVYTGSNVCDKDTGAKIETTSYSDLGFASKIVVRDTENKDEAVLLGGKGEKIKRGEKNLITERQEVLKKQLLEAKNDLSKIVLERRIANLSSAVGVIRVGASSTSESLYLKLKIEDGVFSCKGALEEGYVQGGGLCLKKIAEKLPENILTESLKAPYEQIQKNAGGFLEIEKDVIDPTKVVRLIVEHGVSVAATLLTTHAVVPEIREKSPAEGYEAIARAIMVYTKLQARVQGLLKENEDFMEENRNNEWEKSILQDKD